MKHAESDAELCVLLTPRDCGGHEAALFGWLADAVRLHGLRLAIVAPTPALAQACAGSGLQACTPVAADAGRWRGLLRRLRQWPADRPLLLAPGVLHAQAWLLAAAVLMRRRVWVYVPMAHSAVRMGYRGGAWRDSLLAPWLLGVDAWIAIDEQQAARLRRGWRVRAPVHVLPNRARLDGEPPRPPPPAADGRLRVAFVGRFDAWQKGLDWLAGLLRDQPVFTERCHWRFQGRGPAEGRLLELASALGPQHVVVSEQAPIDDALAASDVLLLPSRYEGLPLVALEATARGWPVLASRDCGLDAWLPPGSLFDFGDAAGLARALESLRSAPARAAAAAETRARLEAAAPDAGYHAALQGLVQALRGRPC